MGCFEQDELPSQPGQYHYMPFRSVGHYKLMGALRRGEPQRCYYVASGAKRHFVVRRWVEYGLLELGEFESS